jgi:hypothetical protein
MGLKSALGRLKKIAEHVDAPTTKIDDWVWRPLSDVHRDTGYIEEVPAYIQDNFGRFMQEQAERARRGEMGPRDLLKAYGITRSSVMRTGRKLDDVERLGLKIYDPEPGLIRPEGAFSSWLLSPAGQKYLDLAEQGVADTDSIEDIRRKFRVFGMQNMLADDLRYAAENLAPKGYELNEMLFAPIDEWRGFTEGIKGVSSGKSGFPASMLGRGDIGTFDAREIKGHTGMSSEDAGKYMSRSRQGRPIGGYEAVDRMGDRQRAMDVRIEPDLEPYYQHIVHHANWDALEGDRTTHNDLIRALRHAAVVAPVAGGAALYRPESEEPEEYARGGLVEDEVEPGLWALMKRYGAALGDMADEEWEAAKARGAKQNAIDYAKGMAANVPMLAGMPVDALDLFRAAMPPIESANPYAKSLRGMLDKYIGTEEEPLYGSEYLMDRVKDAGLDLEGEGLGYQTGNLLGLAGVSGLLKRGVRGAARRLREP